MAAIKGALAAGELTPSEAVAVAGVVETFRRTFEMSDLDRRLATLENRGAPL